MARPKINPEKHRRNVSLTLDPKTLDEATAECAAQGYSLSVTVDALLVDWLCAMRTNVLARPKKWTVLALATALAGIDDEWRRGMSYTGRPVRRMPYWLNMATRIINAGRETS